MKNFNKKNKGGRVIASGGYGCVFDPALKCVGSSKRDSKKITKLMTERHATQEYEEINKIKEKLDSIPNYKDYFLIYDATLCKPAKLTSSDLSSFSDKCTALPKDDITKKNINSKLDEVLALNIPNGGLPVDDYIYHEGSFEKIYLVHVQLINLLKNGILPMNKHGIYHCDIKDSNILIDDTDTNLKARLIDWGLATEYNPSPSVSFPKNWRNRPIQFNVPFSVIIFTDSFYEKYSKYLKDDGEVDKTSLRPFVTNYLHSWMKERGNGHYKFINEIMFMLMNNNLSNIPEKDRALFVETEITLPVITDYIIDVLLHYTKFKPDGSLNLREYLNDVFIKIVDVWGFISVYFPLLELLSNNYSALKPNELAIFKQLEFIFNNYLYNPRHEPIDIDELFSDLKILGNLIHVSAYGKKATTSSKSSNTLKMPKSSKLSKSSKASRSYGLASGIKMNKTIRSKKSPLFKRKPLKKRFKNPFFISIK